MGGTCSHLLGKLGWVTSHTGASATSPLLTCAMASDSGRLSHLRRAKDLMQRVTSTGVIVEMWGCRSVAIFWKTWGWWKFSFP